MTMFLVVCGTSTGCGYVIMTIGREVLQPMVEQGSSAS